MKERISEILEEHICNISLLREGEYISTIEKIVATQIKALKDGKKILIAGNGGSASDAQHFAGEIVGRFLLERKGMPAISLSTDTSVLTCIGNDYGYDKVFSRQVEALGNEGDIFIGISTSGNSNNVIEAVEEAKKQKMITIGFLGKDGGKLASMCDISLIIPFKITARVQEAHIIAIHTICELVEKEMA
ncbi:MAG: D-sedoheptulose 7-phosphate isomerase [Ignavibacteriales bacterium]